MIPILAILILVIWATFIIEGILTLHEWYKRANR